MTFDEAFDLLIGHEGGYVNHPSDPGGETRFGISKRAYPALNIKALSLHQAKAIYRRDYWIAAGCDRVQGPLRFDLFDMAVNSGVTQAIRTLQRAVDVEEDGLIGPATLSALSRSDAKTVQARFNGARLEMMTDLATWPTFGRGWAKRIAANLMRD
jgi:lysozyme family protein